MSFSGESGGIAGPESGDVWAGADLKPAGDVTARSERCGVTAAAVTLAAFEIVALGRLFAASLRDLIRRQ